jgi:hypothetical protein
LLHMSSRVACHHDDSNFGVGKKPGILAQSFVLDGIGLHREDSPGVVGLSTPGMIAAGEKGNGT